MAIDTVQTNEFNAPADSGILDARAEQAGLAEIAVLDNFGRAKADWESLERSGISTPYQRHAWLAPWFTHIGERNAVEPLIVIGRDHAGKPALILPLGVRRHAGVRIASWPSGKHVNYNLDLFSPNCMRQMTGDTLADIFETLRHEARIDVLSLINQPAQWAGIANPLMALPHQPSPSVAYALPLEKGFDAIYAERRSASTRKKLRRYERQIAKEFGDCVIAPSGRGGRGQIGAGRVLCTEVAARLQDRHQSNIFAQPGVMDFYRALARESIGRQEPLLGHLLARCRRPDRRDMGRHGAAPLTERHHEFVLRDPVRPLPCGRYPAPPCDRRGLRL